MSTRLTASTIGLFLSVLLAAATARADAVTELLAEYGGGPFDPAAGAALWRSRHKDADAAGRSCTDCHGSNGRAPGRHAVTGKAIEPLAPSVNPKRLTDRREIEKWLARNCKWTLGRACTGQEKGDLLAFLKAQ